MNLSGPLFALALVIFPIAAKAGDEMGDGRVHQCKPGPWGTLEYYEIILEPPENKMRIGDRLRSPVLWDFPETSVAAVETKLKEMGFDRGRIAQLQRDQEWELQPSGTLVRPSWKFVEEMTLDQRKNVNTYLWDRGTEGVTFNIEGNDFWGLQNSGLPDSVLDRVKQLSYYHGPGLVFSDTPLILQSLPENQKNLFVKMMARTRALVLRLKIEEDSNLEELADYWTVNKLQKTSLPILRSIQSTPGVEWLDVAHLLPPVGRKYLYTYLQLEDAVYSDLPDCYWTAINFSRTTSSRRVLDVDDVGFYLNEDFEKVEPPYRFGDTIVLADAEMNFVHSYVYVADNIVYTKNGKSALYPWMLMREEDMLSRYVRDMDKKIGYRPKVAIEK